MIREELQKYKLPDVPGVYLFKKGRKILYIGKAASLRDRVGSYFSADLVSGRGSAIVGMVAEADGLSFTRTKSVLEALILEANLIKSHQPPYNAASKDNKSFNYLIITKETWPSILVIRGRDLFQNFGFRKPEFGFTKPPHVFGPYPHGAQLQEAIKIIRRIFPFRDRKCEPCGTRKNKNCKPCFSRQIGLCPGVCTGEISKADYARIVRHICELFNGNFKGLKRKLTSEMKMFAEGERFEEAGRVRRQIHALEHIRDVSLIKDDRRIAAGGIVRTRGTRIEAFDVAHTSGAETVAVMTVVEDGHPAKDFYRKFKIRSAQNDDIAALREALSRRLNHPEWPLPRVFAVDGGKAQVRAAERILKDAGLMIPVVGVAKDEFHRPKEVSGDRNVVQQHEKDILLANSEAHRFGIVFHRYRRSRNFK